MTLEQRFLKLEEIKVELNDIETEIPYSCESDYDVYFFEILKLAYWVERMGDKKISIEVSKLAKIDYRHLSADILKDCVKYVRWLVELADNYLCSVLAHIYVGAETTGEQSVRLKAFNED